MTFDVGYTLGGIYEITKVLSETGGMSSGRYLVKSKNYTYFAKVFDIFDPSFQQNGFNQEDLDAVANQYYNEYKVLEKVRCNGVPLVIQYFQEGCFSVVVSEYIPGKNLENLLTEKQKPNQAAVFSQDKVIDWMLDLCNILEYLHTPNQNENRKAIVNRDVKPANIILGEDDRIYLVDFGTAKIRNLVSAQQKTVCTKISFGSPGYAPPEQYLAQIAEPTMDQYALGATMFRLLSGELPISVEERSALDSVGQDNSLHSDSIDPDLEKVIQKMTEMKVKDRYQNISEVRSELQKIKAQAQHRVFAQPKSPTAPSIHPSTGAGASQQVAAGPPNYGIIIPSGCPFAQDSIFYFDPADGTTHSNYALGLVKFTKACDGDLKSRQLLMKVTRPGPLGIGTRSQDVAVPLTVLENYFAEMMQPDLLECWKFTRSVKAYPDNNNTEFKIATEYNALIEFLMHNPNHDKPGIPLSMLPEKTYDQFPGFRLLKKDSIYDRPQTRTEAVNNEALLVLTNNRPDVIGARFDLAINYYNRKHPGSNISEAMGVYPLDNSSGEAQVRALGVGYDNWNYCSLGGRYLLNSVSRFVRVAQR